MRSTLLSFLLLGGCYLSHGRSIEVVDASLEADAASPPDASVCEPQVAENVRIRPDRLAELFLWRWTGVSCVLERYQTERSMRGTGVFPPIGCTGTDCAQLFEREGDCASRYAACGAALELPRRGPSFSREQTVSILCGPSTCTVEQGCTFGVGPQCTPRASSSGLECDDDLDCGAGSLCCATDNGPYVLTTCRRACEARETITCVSDADCGAGASCCQAAAHLPTVQTSIGACTPRTCDPQSRIDI